MKVNVLHNSVDWQSTVAAGCTNSSNSPYSCPESWQLSNPTSSCDSRVAYTFYLTFVEVSRSWYFCHYLQTSPILLLYLVFQIRHDAGWHRQILFIHHAKRTEPKSHFLQLDDLDCTIETPEKIRKTLLFEKKLL